MNAIAASKYPTR